MKKMDIRSFILIYQKMERKDCHQKLRLWLQPVMGVVEKSTLLELKVFLIKRFMINYQMVLDLTVVDLTVVDLTVVDLTTDAEEMLLILEMKDGVVLIRQ